MRRGCAHHVFDLAAGSGAAAMAAAIFRIHYEGMAMNTEHANWLNRILDKAMFAIVVDGTDEDSLKLKDDVNQYFNSNIEEGRRLLASAGDAGGYDVGDEEEDEAMPVDDA